MVVFERLSFFLIFICTFYITDVQVLRCLSVQRWTIVFTTNRLRLDGIFDGMVVFERLSFFSIFICTFFITDVQVLWCLSVQRRTIVFTTKIYRLEGGTFDGMVVFERLSFFSIFIFNVLQVTIPFVFSWRFGYLLGLTFYYICLSAAICSIAIGFEIFFKLVIAIFRIIIPRRTVIEHCTNALYGMWRLCFTYCLVSQWSTW